MRGGGLPGTSSHRMQADDMGQINLTVIEHLPEGELPLGGIGQLPQESRGSGTVASYSSRYYIHYLLLPPLLAYHS